MGLVVPLGLVVAGVDEVEPAEVDTVIVGTDVVDLMLVEVAAGDPVRGESDVASTLLVVDRVRSSSGWDSSSCTKASASVAGTWVWMRGALKVATVSPAAAAIGAVVTAPPICPIGRSVNQARGPNDHFLPNETLRNALTIVGSNCVPEHATSSRLAASGDIGSLYERFDVMTS